MQKSVKKDLLIINLDYVTSLCKCLVEPLFTFIIISYLMPKCDDEPAHVRVQHVWPVFPFFTPLISTCEIFSIKRINCWLTAVVHMPLSMHSYNRLLTVVALKWAPMSSAASLKTPAPTQWWLLTFDSILEREEVEGLYCLMFSNFF